MVRFLTIWAADFPNQVPLLLGTLAKGNPVLPAATEELLPLAAFEGELGGVDQAAKGDQIRRLQVIPAIDFIRPMVHCHQKRDAISKTDRRGEQGWVMGAVGHKKT